MNETKTTLTEQQFKLRETLRNKPGQYVTDGSNPQIKKEDWDKYNQLFDSWFEKHKDNLQTMDAGMSKPNPPNYFRANND